MRCRKLFLIGMMSTMVICNPIVYAGELILGNEIVEDSAGPNSTALISVTLVNDTGDAINNVDLRSNSEIAIAGDNVVQMGSLVINETSIRLIDVIATRQDGTFPDNIIWKVDYDDAVGNHHNLKIGAALQAREGGQ